MVQIKIGDDIVVDRIKVIELCISYFKNLIGPELIINEDVLKARQEFYNVIGCVVNWKRYCYTFQMVKALVGMVIQMKF